MGRRVRIRTNRRDADTAGAGQGILGSGIFGHIGGLVNCDSKDDSFFCKLSKFVITIMYILFLLAIVYLVYIFFSKMKFSKMMKGGGVIHKLRMQS